MCIRDSTEVADELLNEAPRVAKASAFDTHEKKVVTGSITTTVKYPPELNLSPPVSYTHLDVYKRQEILRSARGGADPRIKRGSPREAPASMHVELFSGLYSHLVAFPFERGRQGVVIEVRTDQVDTPLVKQFT